MSGPDDDFQVRPGRPRDGGTKGRQVKSFVGQVMRAANKGGRGGRSFSPHRNGGGGSRFGRGAVTAPRRARQPLDRRVVVKMRVVRHKGVKFTAAPLARHVAYLEREGVTRDGASTRMFDAAGDNADGDAFAERCKDDRHHFRFIVSPEDAGEMEDLRSFTRELMADAQRDLGTSLDWVAVDHWNTDNPHIHILVRGRADDGGDLVIRRDYVREGFRNRAEDRVTLELGPRTQREIEAALVKEVDADRWTSLDRAIRDIADRHGGIVDLRPEPDGRAPDNRQLLIGRAQKLEAMGLVEPIGPAAWTVRPGLEAGLRDFGVRGDIIKTMHKAMANDMPNPDVSRFAIHHAPPVDPVLGRLVARGLYDELEGSAYAVVDGIDGRTHHLRFTDLDMTGDAKPGAIVELRSWVDAKGVERHSLATRSDLTLGQQINAEGATWLDRNLIAREQPVLGGGFGAEVASALEARCDRLEKEGLVQRRAQRVIFARSLLGTLKERELQRAQIEIAGRTGLVPQPSAPGEHVAGVYRERVTLASGRYAMIDNGLGFQLVPWRPTLEQNLGQHVSGTMTPGGGVDWSFGKQRGLGL
ncbi:relaxase/mobilization nuclease domain-containing protein [Brevundimonas diminuta]|uniref:relaxase/mobilization nuclease domain-containing protein n=1 Tax=Brevundimonas diminuta TaxID=293 RepID=UPI0030FBE5DD